MGMLPCVVTKSLSMGRPCVCVSWLQPRPLGVWSDRGVTIKTLDGDQSACVVCKSNWVCHPVRCSSEMRCGRHEPGIPVRSRVDCWDASSRSSAIVTAAACVIRSTVQPSEFFYRRPSSSMVTAVLDDAYKQHSSLSVLLFLVRDRRCRTSRASWRLISRVLRRRRCWRA